MHTHSCLRCKLEVRVSSPAKGSLPPATLLPTPQTDTQTEAPIHVHTGGRGQECHDSTSPANPSSRSAAPTRQLSSPNTLHSTVSLLPASDL